MGIDANRRESFPIDRRSKNAQDGHETMCSSYERVRAAVAGCVCSTSANLVFAKLDAKLDATPMQYPTGVLEGNDGGNAVVLSEELWRHVRGTRLGGIGRNRQAHGGFKGNSGGKVVELCGFLSIPPVHCPGELQGL